MKTVHIIIKAQIGSGVFSVPIEQSNYLSDDSHNSETSAFQGKTGLMKGLAEILENVLFKDAYYPNEPNNHVIVYFNPQDIETILKNDNVFVFGKDLAFQTTNEQIKIINNKIFNQKKCQ